MTEEDLHEQINNLKISSIEAAAIKQPQNDIPLTLNPFFKHIESKTTKLQLFGTKCCRNRSRCTSENSLDDQRQPSGPAGIERTIIHSTQFKHKNSKMLINRRIPLLKDPILRSLQSGLNVKPRKLCCDGIKETDSLTSNINEPPNLDAVDLDNAKNICLTESPKDFRSLVEESQNLSTKKEDVIKRSSSKDCLLNGNKCNDLQNYDSRTKQKTVKNTRPWRNITVSKHDPSGNSGNQSNNISCSQEARINEGVASPSTQQTSEDSCDVTIDELASYFDTLVYIPKEMSSMAEMMYI